MVAQEPEAIACRIRPISWKNCVQGDKETEHVRQVAFKNAGQKHRRSYEKSFSYGHMLLKGGNYGSAAAVFRKLAEVNGRGPRAKLMLAQCEAGQHNYDACKEILKAIFDDEPTIEELQTAFVYHRLGMQNDAIREMAKVVRRHINLPTACLTLGDMLYAGGYIKEADELWKLAIKRDRRSGGVAKAARKQRERLRKKKQRIM